MHKNYKTALPMVHNIWEILCLEPFIFDLACERIAGTCNRELWDPTVVNQVKMHPPDFFVVVEISPYIILRIHRLFFLLRKEHLELLSMLPFSGLQNKNTVHLVLQFLFTDVPPNLKRYALYIARIGYTNCLKSLHSMFR